MYLFLTGQNSEISRFAPTHVTEGPLTLTDVKSTFRLDEWEAVKVPNNKPEEWGGGPIPNSFYLAKSYINHDPNVYKPDHGAVLNEHVTDRYGVIQYSSGVDWLDYYVTEGLVTLDSALYIDDKTLAVTVTSNIAGDVIEGDAIKTYLVLSLGHGQYSKRMLGFTTIRAVCSNTLAMGQLRSLAEMGKSYKLTGNDSLREARSVLDLANEKFGYSQDKYKKWAAAKINAFDKETVFRRAANVVEIEDADSIQLRTLDQLENAYRSSPGMEIFGSDCTAWRLYNAVTYTADHLGSNDIVRYRNSTGGSGSAMRRRATEVLSELVPA